MTGDARSSIDRWWVIQGSMLLELLHRAATGEDPDLLYVEAYANSAAERHEGGGGGHLPDPA